MKKIPKKFLIIICFVIVFCVPATAFGAPYVTEVIEYEPSHRVIELDDNRIFVVLHGSLEAKEGFAVSGLYYNTQPPQLIYMINDADSLRLRQWQLFISSDGTYVVAVAHPLAHQRVEFFANGMLFETHYFSDLVVDSSAIEVIGGRRIYDQEELRRLNVETNEFYIITVDYIEYRFNIETGEIVRTRDVFRATGGGRIHTNINVTQGAALSTTIILASLLVIVFLYFIESW